MFHASSNEKRQPIFGFIDFVSGSVGSAANVLGVFLYCF